MSPNPRRGCRFAAVRPFPLLRPELDLLDAYEPEPGHAAIRLDANESPFELDAPLRSALAARLAAVALNRYPDSNALRLKGLLAKRYGVALRQLLLGAGTDECIGMLLTALGARALGEAPRALYPVPGFSMYRISSLARGVEPIELVLQPPFELTAETLSKAITLARPHVVFLARPNNPTGSQWPRECVQAALDADPDTLVVCDEAYGEFADETCLDMLAAAPRLAILRSLSKLGLAGLRIGVLIASEALVHELEKARLPYNVPALAQEAAAFVLERAEILAPLVARVIAERTRISASLQAIPALTVFASRANFILVRVHGGSARAMSTHAALAGRGILVRNLARPGPLDGCLRITIGTPDENDAMLAAITEELKR